MKKVISAVAILISSTSLAFANDDIDFDTLQKAEQYCPAKTELTFKPILERLDSKGTVTGHKDTQFKNFNTDTGPYVAHPKEMDSTGRILNVEFRQAYPSGHYGMKRGATITCYYTYTSFTNLPVLLSMRN